ncbi:PilZ domain-containing protein [bacterium]|nr:PilZ domain-containing protein [bacterium]
MWALLKQMLFPWRANRSKDRRSERRHRVNYEGKLSLRGVSEPVALEDATVGGTRLRSGRKLVAGQAVVVVFPCGPRDAICRWCRSDGAGWVAGLQFSQELVSKESA